ncbi:unnamed protein product [Protopolystoma xenopodis]|uniref:SAMD1-like winged helix (WH) domain-containing protein n=1 Tax=Protopolystoma xenopodis TaxID=117903 RepID=A0A448WIE9_9PLAT|nr:unnamed protein product [Protopolystoma xenopodis]
MCIADKTASQYCKLSAVCFRLFAGRFSRSFRACFPFALNLASLQFVDSMENVSLGHSSLHDYLLSDPNPSSSISLPVNSSAGASLSPPSSTSSDKLISFFHNSSSSFYLQEDFISSQPTLNHPSSSSLTLSPTLGHNITAMLAAGPSSIGSPAFVTFNGILQGGMANQNTMAPLPSQTSIPAYPMQAPSLFTGMPALISPSMSANFTPTSLASNSSLSAPLATSIPASLSIPPSSLAQQQTPVSTSVLQPSPFAGFQSPTLIPFNGANGSGGLVNVPSSVPTSLNPSVGSFLAAHHCVPGSPPAASSATLLLAAPSTSANGHIHSFLSHPLSSGLASLSPSVPALTTPQPQPQPQPPPPPPPPTLASFIPPVYSQAHLLTCPSSTQCTVTPSCSMAVTCAPTISITSSGPCNGISPSVSVVSQPNLKPPSSAIGLLTTIQPTLASAKGASCDQASETTANNTIQATLNCVGGISGQSPTKLKLPKAQCVIPSSIITSSSLPQTVTSVATGQMQGTIATADISALEAVEFHRGAILDAIDKLRERKARPDFERISCLLKRHHNITPCETQICLGRLADTGAVVCVDYKGNTSYRNPSKWRKTAIGNGNMANLPNISQLLVEAVKRLLTTHLSNAFDATANSESSSSATDTKTALPNSLTPMGSSTSTLLSFTISEIEQALNSLQNLKKEDNEDESASTEASVPELTGATLKVCLNREATYGKLAKTVDGSFVLDESGEKKKLAAAAPGGVAGGITMAGTMGVSSATSAGSSLSNCTNSTNQIVLPLRLNKKPLPPQSANCVSLYAKLAASQPPIAPATDFSANTNRLFHNPVPLAAKNYPPSKALLPVSSNNVIHSMRTGRRGRPPGSKTKRPILPSEVNNCKASHFLYPGCVTLNEYKVV